MNCMRTIIVGLVVIFTIANRGFSQSKATYDGLPSIQYPGSKKVSFFAGISKFESAPAVVYFIGFEPKKSHAAKNAAAAGLVIAGAAICGECGLGLGGFVGGGTASYPGRLFITADQIIFVPSTDKGQKYTWRVPRSSINLKLVGDGEQIVSASSVSKDQPNPINGLIHLQPIVDKSGKPEFKKPDEPIYLHKKHPDPSVEAFLSDFNSSITAFDQTYKRLMVEAGIP